ncbi:hypothetical protein [Microbacterium sp.]|uniref:hypothetical protein n=1 Tax=Microbacterium sp. TaxID=51671 RepID=UPI002C44CE17|nr:hypothetical protein [Microbacterium sp.]HWL77738.1 hypothetical protein [Microbacterium sp.]
MVIEIRVDDLSGPLTQALIAKHLRGMHDSSPPESVHALDLEGLRHPSITFWSAWVDGELAGIGALNQGDGRPGCPGAARRDQVDARRRPAPGCGDRARAPAAHRRRRA